MWIWRATRYVLAVLAYPFMYIIGPFYSYYEAYHGKGEGADEDYEPEPDAPEVDAQSRGAGPQSTPVVDPE